MSKFHNSSANVQCLAEFTVQTKLASVLYPRGYGQIEMNRAVIKLVTQTKALKKKKVNHMIDLKV